jgi:DNA-binding CsgD family transcriptional regulator
MLEAVGLTPVEEQTYRMLVRVRSMTPAEVCQRLNLSREQADAIFGSLAAKGLITATAGPSKRLVAAPADVAGEALLLHRFEELQAARLEFAKIAEEYHSAAGSGSVDELIEIAPAEAVPTLFEQLQRQAQSEVWGIATPPYAVPADQNSVEIERLSCGVAYLALYTQAALEEPGAVKTMRRYVEAGEQARTLPGVSMKMAVFDRKIALVPVTRGPRTAAAADALIVHACSLLDALIELFDRLWLSAVPLDRMFSGTTLPGASPPAGNRAISPQDSQLITLLLAGLTEDAVGRQLGLARRTVVRRIHQLMARAKAANRLQLILQAAQLGWIDAAGRAPAPGELSAAPGGQGPEPNGRASSDAQPQLRATPLAARGKTALRTAADR